MNPNSAFITFETEHAYNKMQKLGDFDLCGEQTKFTDVTEPTNIIWENLYVSRLERIKRFVKFFIVMLILFTCTFLATFYIKSETDKIRNKYETAVCYSMQNSYTSY
jgi:hypothetical protein